MGTVTNDMSIVVGGDAGQGVESSGAGFSLACARAGLHVFTMQDFRSQIRGGHNFYQIRLGERPVYSHSNRIQVLLALTAESVAVHEDEIVDDGAVILPAGTEADTERLKKRGVLVDSLPLMAIAEEHGNRLMLNTALLGALAGLTGFPFENMADVIRENFARKGQQVVDSNLKVAEAAYDLAAKRYGDSFRYRLKAVEGAPRRMLMNGNEAIALGALAAGCRFVGAYPMTPATSVVEYLAKVPHEYGVVMKHAEDEIAAACMTAGASFVGARALTSTSGGGFCLMVETMGLVGMTEVPLVIVDVQRAGPSTGHPTRTEQSDLLFAVHAAHGDFPRVVLAPGTIEECFEAGWRVFNFADKYQCPVVLLSDSFLATQLRTLDEDAIDFGSVVIDRGATLTHEDLDRLENGYLRFKFTETGVSPRAILGHPKAVHVAATDEHGESGHITEVIPNRQRMMKKRMQKLEEARKEMRAPAFYGPADAETTLVCWGSTYGACREAADMLIAKGQKVNVLKFQDVWPLPTEAALQALNSCKRVVAVEQNYSSQLTRLLRQATGFEIKETINKYDGRPLAPEYIISGLGQEVASGYKA